MEKAYFWQLVRHQMGTTGLQYLILYDKEQQILICNLFAYIESE